MLFFTGILVVGVAAVLLAQKMDIECANPRAQSPVRKPAAYKPQQGWTRRLPLARLAAR